MTVAATPDVPFISAFSLQYGASLVGHLGIASESEFENNINHVTAINHQLDGDAGRVSIANMSDGRQSRSPG